MQQARVIEFVRNRGMTAGQISDEAIADITDDVLARFSASRGPMTFDTITTEPGEFEYDVPAGAVSVVGVYWAPGLSDTIVTAFIEDLQRGSTISPHFPSLTIIRDIELNRWKRRFRGRAKWDGGTIRLYPTPDGVYEVPVVFRVLETLASVPLREEQLLLDGVLAYSTHAAGLKLSGTGGWRASRVSVDSSVGRALIDNGERMIREWNHRIGAGKQVTGMRS